MALSLRARPLQVSIGAALAFVLALGACSDDDGDGGSSATSAPSKQDCGLQGGARCAPASKRVDLYTPTFTDPTRITNPRFPTSSLDQVVQLGEEGGEPVRFEITRTPLTKRVRWKGQTLDVLVRQYIAYEGRRIIETALDFFGQADNGDVWYFGEDVANYRDGRVANDEGTWLAGKDGPPGLIMPADPKVGDVFRPENIPGSVFEEVTVKKTGLAVEGPRGQVQDAIRTEEHLQENTFESKVFAPGYGEFKIEASDELVFMGLAVPIDALEEPTPPEVQTLTDAAAELFGAASDEDWTAVATGLDTLTDAWATYSAGDVPPQLEELMQATLDELRRVATERRTEATRQAAVDVQRAALDLALQYRPFAEVDRDRIAAWARQVMVDADAGDEGGVLSDAAILETIRDRITPALDARTLADLDATLTALRTAADDGDLSAAADAAVELLPSG